MIAVTKSLKVAIIFAVVGVAGGVGIATALDREPPQIQQGEIEYEGGNPFLDPMFFKSFQETVRPMANYKSTLVVGEEGFYTADVKGGKEPYQYEWKFSDGVVLNGQSVRRSFDAPGSYDVLLRVTDAAERFNTLTLVTNVIPDSVAEDATNQTSQMEN